MMRYRKRPVEVDAVPAREIMAAAAGGDWGALPDWIREAYESGRIVCTVDAVLIGTLEGEMRGEPADLIVRGIRGELYPCKPDIFADSYERVS